MNIDHIGFVVNNIEESIENFRDMFQFDNISDVFIDTLQKVKVVFLESENGVRIELIEPLSDDSPVKNFLDKGGGLNHIAFQVDKIHESLEKINKNKKSRLVCPPVPGAGHDNNLIAFIHINSDCPRGHIIELVETKKPKI
tara:strand:- start:210 stop:632 length:423 start_codon:yes stop_codon:yes gene_type:complete